MTDKLKTVPQNGRPQPDTFHARTGHELRPEDSKVFSQLRKIEQYATDNKMKLNYKKTKFMLFNPCSSKDFMPTLEINGHEIEDVQ